MIYDKEHVSAYLQPFSRYESQQQRKEPETLNIGGRNLNW